VGSHRSEVIRGISKKNKKEKFKENEKLQKNDFFFQKFIFLITEITYAYSIAVGIAVDSR
jgi:hypothetical protein